MTIDPPKAEWNCFKLGAWGFALRATTPQVALRLGMGLRPSGYDPTRRPHRSLTHFKIGRSTQKLTTGGIHYAMIDLPAMP